MEGELHVYYQAALQVTKTAGQLILDKIYAKKNVQIKSSNIDFVTDTDQAVEELVTDELSKQFPDHKFIGEETVSAGGSCNLTNAPTWIIDPIDGTMNFIHSFPHSCISLALFINKEPKIGIVYNPMMNQLFSAVKDKGAFLNDKRIQVSEVAKLTDALIMMECGSCRDKDKLRSLSDTYQKLVPQVHGIRSLGSAALNMAMVAAGYADAYFEFGIHIWDIAAGELLITEAGGVVLDPRCNPINRLSRRVLCASTKSLAVQLSKHLAVEYYPRPTD